MKVKEVNIDFSLRDKSIDFETRDIKEIGYFTPVRIGSILVACFVIYRATISKRGEGFTLWSDPSYGDDFIKLKELHIVDPSEYDALSDKLEALHGTWNLVKDDFREFYTAQELETLGVSPHFPGEPRRS